MHSNVKNMNFDTDINCLFLVFRTVHSVLYSEPQAIVHTDLVSVQEPSPLQCFKASVNNLLMFTKSCVYLLLSPEMINSLSSFNFIPFKY